jgi:hypothetical protein
MQVPGRKGDGPKFVPLTPSAISAKLLDADIVEFRRSGKELSAEERKKRRIQPKHIRRVIESVEREDGVFTSVTIRKFLARDEATRKLGWADLSRLCGLFEKRTKDGEEEWVQISEGLSFQEAYDQKYITPIHELSKTERKRLAGKSFLYCHVHPRPATVAALMRHSAEDLTLSKSAKETSAELTMAAQRVFHFMQAQGVNDPCLAEILSKFPAIVQRIDTLVNAEVSVVNARQIVHQRQEDLKGVLLPILETYKKDGKLPEPAPPQVSAVLNPDGQSVPHQGPDKPHASAARAAESKSPTTEGRQAGTILPPERDRASRSAPPAKYPDPPVAIPVAELVSQPRSSKTAAHGENAAAAGGPFLAGDEPERMPDAEFKHALIAAFVDAGRPHPAPSKVRMVIDSLPDHAWARAAFLADLKKAMPRIKGPGVLEMHVAGFVDAWPSLLDRLELEHAEERKDREREVARATEILATPPDARDRHGNAEYDDQDRDWARRTLNLKTAVA